MAIGDYIPRIRGVKDAVLTGLAGVVLMGAVGVGDACAGDASDRGRAVRRQVAGDMTGRFLNKLVGGSISDYHARVRAERERQAQEAEQKAYHEARAQYHEAEERFEAPEFVPNVYSIGDVDNDGVEDWRYCKAEGECYKAKKFYKDPASGKYTTNKISNTETRFGYWDDYDVIRGVPRTVSVSNGH